MLIGFFATTGWQCWWLRLSACQIWHSSLSVAVGASQPPTHPTGEQAFPSDPFHRLDNPDHSHHPRLQHSAELCSLQHLIGQSVTNTTGRKEAYKGISGTGISIQRLPKVSRSGVYTSVGTQEQQHVNRKLTERPKGQSFSGAGYMWMTSEVLMRYATCRRWHIRGKEIQLPAQTKTILLHSLNRGECRQFMIWLLFMPPLKQTVSLLCFTAAESQKKKRTSVTRSEGLSVRQKKKLVSALSGSKRLAFRAVSCLLSEESRSLMDPLFHSICQPASYRPQLLAWSWRPSLCIPPCNLGAAHRL